MTDVEFPPPKTPASVTRRESAIIGLLVAVLMASILGFTASRSAKTAADSAVNSADKILATQLSNRQVGIGNRVASCLLIARTDLDLPSVCRDPEVVAASDGRLKRP